MKTVIQALKDETIYPVPLGKIENIVVRRFGSEESGSVIYTKELSGTDEYKGALADCLYSLLQAVNFSEAGMSVGSLTDAQRKTILRMANDLYKEIGEEEKEDPLSPTVSIENWR
jgi:hypothetical protein